MVRYENALKLLCVRPLGKLDGAWHGVMLYFPSLNMLCSMGFVVSRLQILTIVCLWLRYELVETFLFAEDHGIAEGCAAQTGFSTIEMALEQQQELEACVAHNFAARSYLENAIKEFLQDLEDMKAKRNKEQWDFERAKE